MTIPGPYLDPISEAVLDQLSDPATIHAFVLCVMSMRAADRALNALDALDALDGAP